jgi:hypothetical protein
MRGQASWRNVLFTQSRQVAKPQRAQSDLDSAIRALAVDRKL